MAEESSARYAGRGVSSTKAEVHQAIKKIDKGLYPQAFCKVIPDVLTNDPDYAIVMHADGASSLDRSAGGDLAGWLVWSAIASLVYPPPPRRARVYGRGGFKRTPCSRWAVCGGGGDGR